MRSAGSVGARLASSVQTQRRRQPNVPSAGAGGKPAAVAGLFDGVVGEQRRIVGLLSLCSDNVAWSKDWGAAPQAQLFFLAFLLAATYAGGADSGLDLLECLQLHNTSRQGVSMTPGLQRLTPAYQLQGEYRDLRVPQPVFLHAVALLRQSTEFTLSASVRQERGNSGTILSFSHGYNRYLEVQSSGRKDEVRLHYTCRDAQVHVETFPYRLADDRWHQVSLSVSGSQVQLSVDCQPLYTRLLHHVPDTNFSLPQLALWVGQRNNRHSLFKGVLQDVRLISGPHGYLNQCPLLDTSCPTCGQFMALQAAVQQLTQTLHLLNDKLLAAEGRISRLEDCDCRKSCVVNETQHQDGAYWQIGCDVCRCRQGKVSCQPVQCAKTTCKYPVVKPGECCPTCLKQCYHMKTLYDHGERTSPKACFECICEDGAMECTQRDPSIVCPALSCPSNQQFSVAGECCKFCPGVDYCGKGHMCHPNATCINLTTSYACHCSNGFYGNGYDCHDVDECLTKGGVDGNHCRLNTECVNTLGSYACQCLPGHVRVDSYNCAEMDECAAGTHTCHEHATCSNTQGSYHCTCQPGYTGDGFTCSPVCEASCLNGGVCVSPGVCACRRGYHGPNCELDLDECETDLHGCHSSSACVNMPGWYYCKCRDGYRSVVHDTTLGTTCQDINECAEGSFTCQVPALCHNTQGSYECICPERSSQPCSLNCLFEGSVVKDGEVVSPSGMPCRRCECSKGVMTCRDAKCDCSKSGASRDRCCPQCDPRAACRHQELRHVVFSSGERWIYQCQTCECLFGEIDCWSLECPPVSCVTPVLTPGDCCPRCDDDPCGLQLYPNSSTSVSAPGQPCSVTGRYLHSGTTWSDPEDRCTTCSCKDGVLRCSFDVRCSSASAKNLPESRDLTLFSPTQPVTTTSATSPMQRFLITSSPESYRLPSESFRTESDSYRTPSTRQSSAPPQDNVLDSSESPRLSPKPLSIHSTVESHRLVSSPSPVSSGTSPFVRSSSIFPDASNSAGDAAVSATTSISDSKKGAEIEQ